HLADGAHEIDALVEGDVIPLVIFAVLAADGEAVAVHRAAVFHVLHADADDEALLAADAAEVDLHLAVRIVAVEIVSVEGVRRGNAQRAALDAAADAAGIQLPVPHAVFEVV